VQFSFSSSLLSTAKVPAELMLDDSGSRVHVHYSPSALVGVHAVTAVAQGVGAARITAVGSFVGEGQLLDGSWAPLRLRQVFVCPDVDRNILGSAIIRKVPGVSFERDAAPYCMKMKFDESESHFALREYPVIDDAYLWLTVRARPSSSWDAEDREWLAAAEEYNRLTITAPSVYSQRGAMDVAPSSRVVEEVVTAMGNDEETLDDEIYHDCGDAEVATL
jgi:hypothetical protein